jgi:hypothetical protein
MKYLLFLFTIITTFTYAQDTNKVVIDPNSEKPMLIGYTTTEAFEDSSFIWWYRSNYMMYDIDTTVIEDFRERLADIDITIILGTWCGDSRREVPRFLKILEYAGYPIERLTMISVDRNMAAGEINIPEYDIKYVPTFIFYSDDSEIGRIIETPRETLELDMAEILY